MRAIAKLHGKLTGLKTHQTRALERLYRRRVPPHQLIHLELGREIALLSHEISRQLALLVDRQGGVRHVIVGEAKGIEIPELGRARAGTARLRGLRCIHTHLDASSLSQEDLTDMALLRLDVMAAIEVADEGAAGRVHVAHLLPRPLPEEGDGGADVPNGAGRTPPWEIRTFPSLEWLRLDVAHLVDSLEEEFARTQDSPAAQRKGERALLIHVDTGSKRSRPAQAELDELEVLLDGAGLIPCGRVVQRRKEVDPRFVIGRGRLADILMRSMQVGAEALVFSQELHPAQVRSLAEFTDLKILDRTQIILDIFAQRATSRTGKLQVELAQLRYMLPRLSAQHTAMSRLTGGIGGRGPGETKLEIHRRRAFERIRRLERELENLQRKRSQGRTLRQRRAVPVLSLVGYTNAGKSTLLNALTESQVLVADQLFATLDTSSRRLRLPRDQEVIITDTVGFIHDLPKELVGAFRSTLDELNDADLLLHVVDASSPNCEENLEAVERLLGELGLERTPTLRVFNKMDRADPVLLGNFCRRYGGIAVSGLDARSLIPLIEEAGEQLWEQREPEAPALEGTAI
ncbi:MAG: GTPase HflX [Candidatus Tectomicrobia bacterium]|uniref:GTPase HflX n=1 Tax=Tectimicrobiota bacterium TaxID=2528274 RepID=A0A932I254_UNCTE|nr:GTPase HflX [Candidatus Tectomicrobia bacterium]